MLRQTPSWLTDWGSLVNISRSLPLKQINMNIIANAESDKSHNPDLLLELHVLSKLEVENEKSRQF